MTSGHGAYRSLRYANLDMAFATAFVTLFTGPFLVGFVQSLGGGDAAIGILSALPSLAGVLQIPGAVWGRGFPSYKRFVTPGGMAWRVLQAPILLLPFLPMADGAKLGLLVILVGLAGAASNLVNPVYNDWLAEMVPPDSRGYYFSRRNAMAAAVASVVGIGGAWMLDASRISGKPQPWGFGAVFALGLLCAAISGFFYLRMTELKRERPVRRGVREGLTEIARPFSDPLYRKVLFFLVVCVTSQLFPGALYQAFGREVLGLNFRVLQGTAVMMAIGNVLAAPVWGFLSDRYGNKPVLALSLVLLATNPIPWILCVPGRDTYNATLLLSTHVVMGMAWAGVALTQFNLLLSTSPEGERANYLAAGMATTAVVGGVAPLLGAATMATLRGPLGASDAYKVIFGIAIVMRLIASATLMRVSERGSTGLRSTLRDLRGVTPGGMRAMRRLGGGSDPEARAEALNLAAEHGMEIAADRILEALSDPTPSVRRQAAAAVATLKDPRAVTALVDQLRDHPDLVEEPVVDALGRLGDARAVPALEELLRAPRPLLRRAAARALGRIAAASPDALSGSTALDEAASDPTDPDLRRAALQALRLAGGARSAGVIVGALSDPHPSVRIAAAEAVAELELREAAPALRRALSGVGDEAGAEIAYALGAVGDEMDLPVILGEASRSSSPVTRRRALLGAARRLGVERETYRLMLTNGMARSAALAALVPRGRADLKAAARLAAAGNEAGALTLLARRHPSLEPLARYKGDEAILVALPAARLLG